jgi:hypothetical protein
MTRAQTQVSSLFFSSTFNQHSFFLSILPFVPFARFFSLNLTFLTFSNSSSCVQLLNSYFLAPFLPLSHTRTHVHDCSHPLSRYSLSLSRPRTLSLTHSLSLSLSLSRSLPLSLSLSLHEYIHSYMHTFICTFTCTHMYIHNAYGTYMHM